MNLPVSRLCSNAAAAAELAPYGQHLIFPFMKCNQTLPFGYNQICSVPLDDSKQHSRQGFEAPKLDVDSSCSGTITPYKLLWLYSVVPRSGDLGMPFSLLVRNRAPSNVMGIPLRIQSRSWRNVAVRK